MTDRVPRLAITMGDPAGVGPEIIVKACRRLLPRIEAGELRLLVIGHRSALNAAQRLLHETLAFRAGRGRAAGLPCRRRGGGADRRSARSRQRPGVLPTSRWPARWNWRWRGGSMPSSPRP